MLRWLEKDNILHFSISTTTTTCIKTTYADDLAIIMDNISHIQPQIIKLQKVKKDTSRPKYSPMCHHMQPQ